MPYSLSSRRSSQNIVFQPRKKLLVSAVGGEVFINGDYKHHVFKSTDSFRLFFRATGSTFNYLVVAGASNGFAGSGGQGGNGGSGSYRSAVGENLNRFNLHAGYTVTVGGAGSHSTIATNSTSISSAGSVIGGAGFGGSPDTSSPGCTGDVVIEDICCCYDSNNDGVTCCDANQCDPSEDPGCCCDRGDLCGQTAVCTTNCEQCGGDVATAGGQGGGGVADPTLVFGGPYGGPTYTNFAYGQGGGGGGGGGYSGGGGAPNGGNGGYPVSNGGNGQANSGVGGGGGGGREDGEYCNNITECIAGMSSGPSDATPGTGGTGGSGIVFIVYKFQE